MTSDSALVKNEMGHAGCDWVQASQGRSGIDTDAACFGFGCTTEESRPSINLTHTRATTRCARSGGL